MVSIKKSNNNCGSPRCLSNATYLLMTAVLVLMAGCTTVKDFQNLGPRQRAERICNNRSDITAINNRAIQLQNQINDIELTLRQGYRVHVGCHWVQKPQPLNMNCNRYGNSLSCYESSMQSMYSCDDLARMSTVVVSPELLARCQQVCNQSSVSISYDLEKEKLANARRQFNSAVQELNSKYNSCILYAQTLSAEQSYEAWKYGAVETPDNSTRVSNDGIVSGKRCVLSKECPSNTICARGVCTSPAYTTQGSSNSYQPSKSSTLEEGQSCNYSAECKGSMLCKRGYCAQK